MYIAIARAAEKIITKGNITPEQQEVLDKLQKIIETSIDCDNDTKNKIIKHYFEGVLWEKLEADNYFYGSNNSIKRNCERTLRKNAIQNNLKDDGNTVIALLLSLLDKS